MTERVWQLRAMSVADLLDETIRLYRHNFLTFVGIVALLQAPVTLLLTLAQAYLGQYALDSEFGVTGDLPSDSFMVLYFAFLGVIVLLGILNFLVVNNLVTAALARAISNRYLDEPVSILGAYRSVLHHFFPLLGALVLLVLINVGLALLFFIPCVGWLIWIPLAVLINVRLAFIPQSVVLEDCPPRQALSRSWDLVQGYGWRTLGVFVLIYLFSVLISAGPSAAVTFGLQALGVSFVIQTIVTGVLSIVLTILYKPIQLTGMTLLYYDLRIRKEGLDLELQVMAFDEEANEPLLEHTALDLLAAGDREQETRVAADDDLERQIEQASEYHDRGDLHQAVRTYWAAIAQRPDDASLHNDLGLALHDLGNLDAALREFTTATELEPDEPTAYYNLALLQRNRGDLDAAREALQTYLALEPDPEVRASVEADSELTILQESW